MIEESAQVVATEGEFAWVETQRQSTCGGCAANKGCGTATLAKVLGKKRTRVRALNHSGAQVGDQVIVGVEESALVRGSLAVYAVPLLTLLAGSIIGSLLGKQWLLEGEGLALVLGGVGLLAGLAWLKGFTRRISHDSRYQPVVLRRLAG
jgi:sigma-E factor negative regulatory protein RseC